MKIRLYIIFYLLTSGTWLSYAQNNADSLSYSIQLKEITITGDYVQSKHKKQSLDAIRADKKFLINNRSTNLMSTLDNLPGVSSMTIGQGFSKPVVRGLGFNRVAVVENGIKQQGQQWGADHGLEIDQFNVDNVEIIKGPASLQYGSDAIAGVIVLQSRQSKPEDGLSGSLLLNGNSNNYLFGGSGNIHYQKDKKYIQARFTYQNFQDYRVPTDSFRYLNWTFPIHNNTLKNTAGRENDLFLQIGKTGNKSAASLSVSNVHAQTGFFAGAHGIPSGIKLEDDGNYRNIDLPYQDVNHFKAIFNQTLRLSEQHRLSSDWAYQYNHRQEYSEPHTHGYGPVPEGDLELELRLQTAGINVNWEYKTTDRNTLNTGINSEFQYNRIGGYSFLLPDYEQLIAGIFVTDKYQLNNKWLLTAGIRYDLGFIHIHRYTDPGLPEEYKERSPELNKDAGDASFGAGFFFTPNQQWEIKANIGKSFRFPTANEYSSNGIHHGTFRHELGDSSLTPENSYQLDLSVRFEKTTEHIINRYSISAGSFFSYFPNFIFLNPTGQYSWLPDAGQYYQYMQSEAFRTGGEISAELEFLHRFRLNSSVEYVMATDMESGYPIPFTPPFNWVNEFSFQPGDWKNLNESRIAIGHRYVAPQNRVARNEQATPGCNLIDLSVSSYFKRDKQKTYLQLMFRVQNLFDATYYNHISFYRYLDIPEMGRNFMFSTTLFFN